MNILLCERINNPNQYVEQLVKAYRENGHSVILDVQNFLYSDFLPDCLHIQWPEAIYRWRHKLPESKKTLRLLESRLLFYQEAGVPIVYTVHNLLPHEAVAFDKSVYALIIRFADLIVHHGDASIPLIKRYFPGSKDKLHISCPHGPYPYKPCDGKKAREMYKLPNSKYIILNFGYQRHYKGADFIEETFRKWNDKGAYLFTLGNRLYDMDRKDNYSKIKYFLERINTEVFCPIIANLSTRSKKIIRKVDSSEIPAVLAACDVLFLGHRKGLNSGLLSLAASYGKPVVFPDIGNFREQMLHWEWKEVYDAESVDSAVKALANMKTRLAGDSPGGICFENKKWLENNSWDKHVKNILDALKNARK